MALDLASLFPAETRSESETRRLGAALAQEIRPGTVIALSGPLGSGKTQFVIGVCGALGIDEGLVSSPTFTIVHEYQGRIPVYHVDLYRIRTPEEAASLGLEEYVESDGLCLIEWPELLGPHLPADTISIRFSHEESGSRRIRLESRAIAPSTRRRS